MLLFIQYDTHTHTLYTLFPVKYIIHSIQCPGYDALTLNCIRLSSPTVQVCLLKDFCGSWRYEWPNLSWLAPLVDLRWCIQLQKEVERMTHKDIGAKIRRFFTPAKVDKLLSLMSSMKQKALVKEYVDRIGRVSNTNMDG